VKSCLVVDADVVDDDDSVPLMRRSQYSAWYSSEALLSKDE